MNGINILRINVLAIKLYGALNYATINRIIHSVEASKVSRFSTTRRANQRRDLVSIYIEIDPE